MDLLPDGWGGKLPFRLRAPRTIVAVVEGALNAKRLGALAHPIRVSILEAAEAEAVSPSDVASTMGEPLGVVAYHFRVLHDVGLIELAATERRRGSIQSFYRANRSGWSRLATTLHGMVGEAPQD
jgi:DNA-binding transcriptional ArsR family regulator